MAEARPILIAGGGIGGLSAALALSGVGRSVSILERLPAVSEAGAGIQLGPNAVKILRVIGAYEAVRAIALAPDALVVHAGASGAVLSRMALGDTIEARHGAPYWVAHRADLHAALLSVVRHAPRIAMAFGAEVQSITERNSETGSAGVRAEMADGRIVEGAGLIGADGLWSRVRGVVVPDAKPQPSGFGAYRALVSVADAGVLNPEVVGAWLSPTAHVVHYPVRGGAEINIVVIVRGDWNSESWNAPASADAVGAAVAGFSPGLRAAVAAAGPWHKWSLPQPLVLPTWSRGAVTLLGDAAHAMLPFFAQGAVMALEDAATLAREVGRAGDDVALAFARFATARRARVARVQSASSDNGRIFHMAGIAGVVRDTVLRATPSAALQARFDWLYGYEVPAAV